MSAIELLRTTAHDEYATHALARALAALCRVGDCVLLSGDLGAGKTSFARAFIQTITGIKNDITSPTFTLVQTYALPGGGELYHCDLYRVKHREELLELGLDDAFANGITLIEWPEIARADMPATALNITIGLSGDTRIFSFSGEAASWQNRLAAMGSI